MYYKMLLVPIVYIVDLIHPSSISLFPSLLFFLPQSIKYYFHSHTSNRIDFEFDFDFDINFNFFT